MRNMMARSLLLGLINISIAWTIESLACGHLPRIHHPHSLNATPLPLWPWHSAIFHRLPNSEPTYECGGTLISQNWVLTAAHCMFRDGLLLEPNKIGVSLGRLNLAADETRREQSFNVTEIVLHENYDSTYLDNNIALARLSHPATFNRFVQPICLWKPNATDLSHVTSKLGTVVGWDKTETYRQSNVLEEAKFKVVSHLQCLLSNRDFYGSYLTENSFCAGLQNGTRVCLGDTGGSMTIEEDGTYYIRGIVSVAPSKRDLVTHQLNCDTMEYAIYTDVAKYLQWIGDATTEMECQTVVRCVRNVSLWGHQECNVDVQPTQRLCKIIFDESPDSTITSLSIGGEFESIPDVSDAVSKFKNLERLRFSEVKLQVVDRARLSAFSRIKWLDLSHNRIADLDVDTFGDLKDLRYLYLNNNAIKILPQAIFRDNELLQLIRIDGNLITDLHVDLFRGLKNLEELSLYENLLDILPADIFRDNRQLQQISLNQNFLSELHVDLFKGLTKLENLFLFANQLETLPPGLFRDNPSMKIIQLECAEIASNQLQHLFRSNQQLQEIGLKGNLISEIPADLLEGLHSLARISLYNNKLASLPPSLFRDNEQLLEISLDANQLEELHVDLFKGLTKLENLYLHDNQLEQLPEGIFRDNQNLIQISLQNNKIKRIDSDFSHLSKLKRLNVLGNVCIDEDFKDLDSSEVMKDIRAKCSN